MADGFIYHLCTRAEWAQAEASGHHAGSSQDAADGFIHFSTADQIAASAARHRAGQDNLVIVEADAARLGSALRWERARGGALFPHLYATLPLACVTRTAQLPLGPDGRHALPWGLGGGS